MRCAAGAAARRPPASARRSGYRRRGASAPAAAVAPKAESAEPAKKGNPVVSPMVGTFYSKPAPDKEAFVKVGDTVSSGDVVCIIEAMKLMNEIETEFSGKVVEICVEDGQAVEYGQTIMYIE